MSERTCACAKADAREPRLDSRKWNRKSTKCVSLVQKVSNRFNKFLFSRTELTEQRNPHPITRQLGQRCCPIDRNGRRTLRFRADRQQSLQVPNRAGHNTTSPVVFMISETLKNPLKPPPPHRFWPECRIMTLF